MHSDKFYNVNFRRLAVMLLPVSLRGNVLTAYASVMGTAFAAIHASLATFRTDRLADLRVTGQTRILRAALNDRWDPDQRRIDIIDGLTGEALMVHRRTASVRTFAYARGATITTWAYRRGMTSGGTAFIVRVPAEVHDDPEKRSALTSFVENHRLVGKIPLIMSY